MAPRGCKKSDAPHHHRIYITFLAAQASAPCYHPAVLVPGNNPHCTRQSSDTNFTAPRLNEAATRCVHEQPPRVSQKNARPKPSAKKPSTDSSTLRVATDGYSYSRTSRIRKACRVSNGRARKHAAFVTVVYVNTPR